MIATQGGNAAYIVLWPPVACGCGRMASFVVNRDGKTRCVECDMAGTREPDQTGGYNGG